MSIRTTLETGCRALGITLPPEAAEQFEAYYAYLREQNSLMDLTAVEGEDETAARHFVDSLSLLRFSEPAGARVVDIGSGAGFPGLPLKLAVPSMSLTLIDAKEKRVDFLAALCDRLGIAAECVAGRAEELALMPQYRDAYDLAVSRAVARLNLLCELTLPFVRPGGALLAMKAADCQEETEEAANAVRILGGSPAEILPLQVLDTPRSVVRVRKAAGTPSGYPRRFSRIRKNPL